MSDAIKKLHDYLAKSPSVVYPEDVFAYLPAIEAENGKLRELFNETLIRLAAASEAAGGGFMDARYCELLKNHGIEVGK